MFLLTVTNLFAIYNYIVMFSVVVSTLENIAIYILLNGGIQSRLFSHLDYAYQVSWLLFQLYKWGHISMAWMQHE